MRAELRDLGDRLRQLRERRDELKESCDGIFQERGELQKRVKELKGALDGKFEERRRLLSEIKHGYPVDAGTLEAIDRLEYEKLRILAEAEVTTLRALDEHRKMKACRSLIDYLGRLGNEPARPGRVDADLALIAALRQMSKKGKRMKKAQEDVTAGQLCHPADILQLFEMVEIAPPLTIEAVQATTEFVQQKLSEWASAAAVSEEPSDEIEIESTVESR
jgi:chromosome segregation ATPase